LKVTEVIEAWGHVNIMSTHRTTFEITRESFVTKRGDCVVAVSATKSAGTLHPRFKEAAKKSKAKIVITIEADGVKETVEAKGSPRLTFTHPTDLVVRKSDYACRRTVAIRANKAAKDLPRKLIMKLQNPDQKIKIVLKVEVNNEPLRLQQPAN
jgi:hypothetical protein